MAERAKVKKLLIAVPTTGGQMKSKTAESLIRLMKVLTKAGVDADIHNINNSDVTTVRNRYANMVLEADRWDALLFIDSDMAFSPKVVLRMIEYNAPVTAAACTTREINLAKFGEAMRDHGDFDRAKAECMRFNVLLSWDNRKGAKLTRRAGFCTVAAIGMAVCLIRKEALQAMVDAGAVPSRSEVFDGVKKTAWGFFDFALHAGITLTEDFSFCHRWNAVMGQPLWATIEDPVEHIGDFHYEARYALVLDQLTQKAKAREVEKSGN